MDSKMSLSLSPSSSCFLTWWNPIRDIQESWLATPSSMWGKAKVLSFYTLLWPMIGINVIQIIFPLAMGTECTAQTADANSKGWISLLTREYALFLVTWLIAIVQRGPTITNLLVFNGTIFIGGCLSWIDQSSIQDQTCYDSLFPPIPLQLMAPAIPLLCALLERQIILSQILEPDTTIPTTTATTTTTTTATTTIIGTTGRNHSSTAMPMGESSPLLASYTTQDTIKRGI